MTKVIDKYNGAVPEYKDGGIYEIPLADINVDPQKRTRKQDNRLHPKYRSIKKTMQYRQFYPILLDMNLDLIGGFLRFDIATELGWETIEARTLKATEFDKLLIEIIENYSRIDFTSHEFYIGIANLKEMHVKQYSEMKQNKSSQTESYSSAHILKRDLRSQFLLIPKAIKASFASTWYEFFGLTARILNRKARIGLALKNKIFAEKIIELSEKGEITERSLITELNKIENQNASIEKSRDNSQLSEPNLAENTKEEEGLEKAIKLFEASKNDLLVKEQYVKVKKQKVSLNKGYENTLKIEEVKKSVKEGIISNFENAGKKYEKKKNKNSKEAQDVAKNNGTNKKKESSIKKMYICIRCPKATVLAVPCKCEECGHPNFATTVLCDEDMINGFHKLRSPNSVLCEKSPDYDLILKKVF